MPGLGSNILRVSLAALALAWLAPAQDAATLQAVIASTIAVSAPDAACASAIDLMAPTQRPATTSWKTWWKRNRRLIDLREPTRTRGLLPALDSRWSAAAMRASWLGMSPESFALQCASDVDAGITAGDLLPRVALPGEHGAAAIVALGMTNQPSVVALLESIVGDDIAGRKVTGESPVSIQKRIAASLGLGLITHATAAGALRGALTDGTAREDAVEAALLLSLGLSTQNRDAPLFLRYLRDGRGGTAAREAAAVGMGRVIGGLRDGRQTFAALLATDPKGAGRGVAGSAWLVEPEPDDPIGPALSDAASDGRDATTRVMSLISLAGRADPRSLDLIDRTFGSETGDPAYAMLALGLLGRSKRAVASDVLRLIDRFRERSPDAAEVASALAAPAGGRGRTATGSARMTGGNGGFVDAVALQSVIDLIAQ